MEKELIKTAYKKINSKIPLREFDYDELKCLLITEDGVGKEIKLKVLAEIENW